MAKAQNYNDVIRSEDLAKLLHLPDFEEFEYEPYVFEAGDYAYKSAIDDGQSDSQAEAEQERAEHAAQAEQWSSYISALSYVAEELFGKHRLNIHESKKRSGIYRITPQVDWPTAANAIRTTINGYGQFEFSSLREFLDSGPWTARQAVLQHLNWIWRWPEIYTSGSPRSMFERYIR